MGRTESSPSFPKTLAAGVFVAGVMIAVAGQASAQDAPTGPGDPRCAAQPTDPVCQGGPYPPPPPPGSPDTPPTGPLDPACGTDPSSAACTGSPYLPPAPPAPPPPPLAAPPIAAAPIAPIGAPFDTFTLGPHIDDMMPMDDTAMHMAEMGHLGMGHIGMGHIGGMGSGHI